MPTFEYPVNEPARSLVKHDDPVHGELDESPAQVGEDLRSRHKLPMAEAPDRRFSDQKAQAGRSDVMADPEVALGLKHLGMDYVPPISGNDKGRGYVIHHVDPPPNPTVGPGVTVEREAVTVMEKKV